MTDTDERISALLRDAAGDAGRATVPPGPDVAAATARARHGRRVAGGAFALVACVLAGSWAMTGARPDASPPAPAVPPAVRDLDDPVLRPYRTDVPVLMWTPQPGAPADEVDGRPTFRNAVLTAVPGGGRYISPGDLREAFPRSPVGGPALLFMQTAARAQLEQAAQRLRAIGGVAAARVIDVPGMRFTMTVGRTYDERPASPGVGVVDTSDLPGLYGLNGSGRHTEGGWRHTVRLIYSGPDLDRARFDLVRARVAASVGRQPAAVTVTP
jgi:hypothetical protein